MGSIDSRQVLERELDLTQLSDALARVRTHGGQAVFVQGEAGIGKTTLIEEFLGRLPGNLSYATALCDPLTTPRPLGPARDLARALLRGQGLIRDDVQVFEGLLHHLQSASAPVVLVIEDLHWVDHRTLDWLTFLGRRLAQLPVFLIGSFRADELEHRHPLLMALAEWPGQRRSDILLQPLGFSAIRTLAQGCALLPDELHRVTGGNPFFITEILSADDAATNVPVSVAAAVNARLNVLAPSVQRFVETVACSPVPIPYTTLRDMDLGDVAALCDIATARQILVPDGADFRFRHELVRRAASERMPPAAKREAHEKFLSAHLSAPDPEAQIDLIVHHAHGAYRRDLIHQYGPKAAKAAADLGAHREAAQHLAEVLKILDGSDPRFAAEIHERWAYEAGLSLAVDAEVIAAREKAVALWRAIGDTERVGENLRWLSRLHWYRGEADLAQSYIHEAIETLEGEGASPARAKAFGLRAQFHMLQDQMDDALIWGQRAYDMAVDAEEHEMMAHALNTMGSARMFRGDAGGEAQLRESLAISLEHNLHEQAARVYTNLSECLVEMRRLEDAAILLEEGIAFDTANDLDSWTYYLVGRKAQLSFELDHYDEALAIAQDVLARGNQTLLMRMPAMIVAARSRMRLGHGEAAAELNAATEAADKIGEPQYLVTVGIAQIEAAILHGGDPGPAIQKLAAQSPEQFSPRKRGEFLFWAGLAGHPVDGAPGTELPPGFLRMLEGDLPAAIEGFVAEQSNYLAAWTKVLMGAHDEADRDFERIGAIAARKALRRRADIRLPAIGRGPYRAARQHPYGLTRAEQRILARIAAGKSNAAIAADLSRSSRTVENHVSSILSKLRCKNRLEVILRIQNEGWILAGAGPEREN